MWVPCAECNTPIMIGIGGATMSGKTVLAKQLKEHYDAMTNKETLYICQDEFFATSKQLMMEEFRNCECPESIDMGHFIEKIKNTFLEATIPCKNCTKKKPAMKKSKSQQLKTISNSTSNTGHTNNTTTTTQSESKRHFVLDGLKKMGSFLIKSKESPNSNNTSSKEETKRQRSASYSNNQVTNISLSKKSCNINNIIIVDGFLLYCDERIYSHFDLKLFIDIPRDVCLRRRITTKKAPQAYFDRLIWPSYLLYNAFVLNGHLSNVFILDGEREFDEVFSEAAAIIERQVGNLAPRFEPIVNSPIAEFESNI